MHSRAFLFGEQQSMRGMRTRRGPLQWGSSVSGQFSTWEEDLIQGEKTSLIYFNIPKQRISFRNGDGLSSRIANDRDLQFV